MYTITVKPSGQDGNGKVLVVLREGNSVLKTGSIDPGEGAAANAVSAWAAAEGCSEFTAIILNQSNKPVNPQGLHPRYANGIWSIGSLELDPWVAFFI